jgi:hypothetical protein
VTVVEDLPSNNNQLAFALNRELVTATPLHTAQAAVEAKAEDILIHHLVALQESDLGSQADAIRKIMSLLESAMEREPAIATRLMGCLYPLAAQLFLHEVCDAIDIWIYEYHPAELAEVFRKKAQDIATGYMGRKYMEWATAIDDALAK